MNISRRLHFIIATLVTVGFLALVGALMFGYAKQRFAEELMDRFLAQEKAVALQIAEIAQDDVITSASFLSALGRISAVQSGAAGACNKILQDLKPNWPLHVDRITRTDRAGIITCSSDQKLIGLNATIFDDAIQTLITDPDHKPVIGELTILPNSTEYSLSYHVALRDENGAFAGLLKATTNVSTIRSRYEQNPAFRYIGAPMLIDESGSVLYAYNADMLNKNVFADDVESNVIDRNMLQHILQLAQSKPMGDINYRLREKEHVATYQRIEVIPGHTWILILASEIAHVQDVFLTDLFYLTRTLIVGNLLIVAAIIILFVFYTTRKFIRPEAIVSGRHERHMRADINNINQAFAKVTENLSKVEEHLAHDINVLHNEAEKKQERDSGKMP